MSALFVEMSPEDRELLNRLAANSSVAAGRPVSVSAVVRQLVRNAAREGAPVLVEATRARR